MAQTQVYEGTFAEITRQHGKQLADRHVKVTVEETEAKEETPRPFYETATTEEWIAAFEAWGDSKTGRGGLLSDEATDRDSIYEGCGE